MTQHGIAVAFRRPAVHPLRVATVLAVALALLVAAPAEAGSRAKKPRIALLDFPAASNAFACAGWSNSEGRMANVLRDLYTSEISDGADGKVRLVERERLADLRSELTFQQSAEVDGATAQKLGKLLGVQFVITGKITRFACKKSDAGTGWGLGALVGRATGSSFAGDVAGSVKTKKVTLSGRIDARLIDVRTGEIMGTWKEENETGDLSVAIAGGGVDVAYDDELVGKVFEPIASKMAAKMVPKILKAAKEREEDDEEAEEDEPAAKKKAKKASDDDAQATAAEGGKGGAQKGSSAGGGAVPEVFGNDFDFVPGEQVLVVDDFSDTEVGDYPARWTIKGGGGGTAEVVESQGKRWFKQRLSTAGSYSQKAHVAYLRHTIKGDLPPRFTVEFDALAGPNSYYVLRLGDAEALILGGGVTRTANTRLDFPEWWQKVEVQHVSIAVNGTSLKAYVGGRRIVNDPDAVTRPIPRLGLAISGGQDNPNDGIMITNFRLGEGGKDITQAIQSEGRIVTHGITFDTGSDRIRPESGPTLRKLQKLLQDDAGLSLEVQGHTDNQGGDKVNGPLSEKRAAAVKAWLVAQGIEDGRLTTRGLGATKPLKGNETLEGRAENRRVEFVKRGG
jgi:outer membrane protein OmpA-like peptidoglycan-associated protein/curli biogenesis system outer membrane secretion channel CsgG